MKTQRTANKSYSRAGAGYVLLLVVGMLAASLIGGVIGINIASNLFGSPLTSAPTSNLMIVTYMLIGIIALGSVSLAGLASVGWFTGSAVDCARVWRVVGARLGTNRYCKPDRDLAVVFQQGKGGKGSCG